MTKYVETKEDKSIEFYTNSSSQGRVVRVCALSSNGSGVILGSAGIDGAPGAESDNIKLHRGNSQVLEIVKGDSVASDGVSASSFIPVRGIFVSSDISNLTSASRNAVVLNTMSGSETDQSGSVSAVKSYMTNALIPNNQAIANLQNFKVPVGAIFPWSGGYFTSSANGGSFINVLGGGSNNIATANSYLNPKGYYICNGVALNVLGAPVFNSSGRYVPDLTDSRFIQGSTSFGAVGGSNNLVDHTHTPSLTMAHSHTLNHSHDSSSIVIDPVSHTHALSTSSHRHRTNIFTDTIETGSSGPEVYNYFDNTTKLSTGYAASHRHTLFGGLIDGPSAHSHTFSVPLSSGLNSGAATSTSYSGSIGTGSGAASTENRPKYLAVLYAIRVI